MTGGTAFVVTVVVVVVVPLELGQLHVADSVVIFIPVLDSSTLILQPNLYTDQIKSIYVHHTIMRIPIIFTIIRHRLIHVIHRHRRSGR